jgi:hypothetical protein
MADRDLNSDPDAIEENTPLERRLRRPADDDADEPRARKDGDWFSAIGPEDEDPDVIEDQLEDYGLDLLDEDELVSIPGAADMEGWKLEVGDDPDEVGDELYATSIDADDNLSLRPVEDIVIDDLDGNDYFDDPEDPEDDLNFPQPRDAV